MLNQPGFKGLQDAMSQLLLWIMVNVPKIVLDVIIYFCISRA